MRTGGPSELGTAGGAGRCGPHDHPGGTGCTDKKNRPRVQVAAPAAERQWKESPQAQEPVALGLSMVKPCFSIVSTKSMVAPVRYGPLILSVTTSTPLNSATMSPSNERSSK